MAAGSVLIETETLRQALLDATRQLGLAITDAHADRLLGYVALLHRWNATYNLTSVREPAQMLTLHVADCLAVIEPLRRQMPAGSATTRLLDVGSGGGLPGVVIAIMNPAVSVTCVDSVGKKTAFVQQVAGELRLPNLHAKHARVENLGASAFDVITSRAFSTLADFTRLTRPCLAAHGVWMAMKGKVPADEIAELATDISVFHVEPITVPGLDAERCIVWMRPA